MAMASAKKGKQREENLADLVFSWKLEDVFNKNLYSDKVQKVPMSFTSVEHYLKSFIPPLIEETHADLCSSMEDLSQTSICNILSVRRSKGSMQSGELIYDMRVMTTDNKDQKKKDNKDKDQKKKDNKDQKKTYEPMTGDIFALSNINPLKVRNTNRFFRLQKSYTLCLVTEGGSDILEVRASKPIEVGQKRQNKNVSLFGVYLINIITNGRIWDALNRDLGKTNVNLIKAVLHTDSQVGRICNRCSWKANSSSCHSESDKNLPLFDLNESQRHAVLDSLSMMRCYHKNSVNLIWGPPGTGKTKTMGTLLWALLRMKCRTLTCAPTNIAVVTATSRILSLVKESLPRDDFGLGDIVLLGNKERMKIDDDDNEYLRDVFLDHRVKRLAACLAPHSGWRHQLDSVIRLLEDPVTQYNVYLENEKKKKEKEKDDDDEEEEEEEEEDEEEEEEEKDDDEEEEEEEEDDDDDEVLTFRQYLWERFRDLANQLKECIKTLLFDLPKSIISKTEAMRRTPNLLKLLCSLLQADNISDNDTEEVFMQSEEVDCFDGSAKFLLRKTKSDLLLTIKFLRDTFNINPMYKVGIRKFILKNACLIFCTVSSSAKLNSEDMNPFELLVIDEAAQLKECESAIPLQLPGLRHAILVGDELQLPAMVKSKLSEKAAFGRSLFERLVLLGHEKHLLEVQYRMHPSISLFPKREFYDNKISDAPNVKESSYEKHFLTGNMYRPFSFINITCTKETKEGPSWTNMVEVDVILHILRNLSQASIATKPRLSVGVISPYKGQVFAIQKKLGSINKMHSDFEVSVGSVDGFQGSERDVIIISTVRSNANGSVGFLSNHQRTNVALTRAKHCLWVLGNGSTLINSGSIWEKLVLDAKDRGCFFNADEDASLNEAISLFDDSLNIDVLLPSTSRWKAIFDDYFRRSFKRIERTETQKEIIGLLTKLLSGWRSPLEKRFPNNGNGTSSQILEQYKVDEQLHLLWTVDVMKENLKHIQVLKVWNILLEPEIPKLAKRLNGIYRNYTLKKLDRCKFKKMEGNLVVPMSWKIYTPSWSKKVSTPQTMEDLLNSMASLSVLEYPNSSAASTSSV